MCRPGREQEKGPPMGKFLGASALGQFLGAEFKNRWDTGVVWGFQPLFHDLESRFVDIAK